MNEPFIFKIIGAHSKTGKTTALEAIVPILKKRNLKVGTVKHSPNHEFGSAEKDTSRHLDAGADLTMALTPSEVIYFNRRKEAPRRLHSSLYQFNALSNGGFDVIILEGFKKKSAPYPAVIVSSNAEDALELVNDHPNFLFITGQITSNPEEQKKLGHWKEHVIALSNTTKIWKRISQSAIKHVILHLPGKDCETCGYPTCEAFADALWNKATTLLDCAQIQGSLRLELDGTIVPLVGFVQQIIAK
ncbi:molybdopterin-guanine dinucleotide biosynthesis protein B, partial [bacterium]|nr:molybdopterin-guanine dinucleotide biosynthesis protein B [bacterium]